MRLAAIFPVGPGEADRHLERCLLSARGWADTVVIYGDGPDPATCELIEQHADRHWIGDNVHAQGEYLVRNRLLDLAEQHLDAGDIVAVLDADEELAGSPDRIRETLTALEHSPRPAWSVSFLHLWAPDGSVHRVDGLWQPSIGPRIFREAPGIRVEPYGGGWVCPPLPPAMFGPPQPVATILHWGYALPEDRPKKYERYRNLPGHAISHIESIIGEPTLERVPDFE